MQDLPEYYKQSLFSSICEVSRGLYSPYIDSNEANGVISSCINPNNKNIITCRSDLKEAFLKEIDGLELNSNLFSTFPILPSYIPIVDKRKLKVNETYIGITLSDILKKGVVLKAGSFHEQDILLDEEILFQERFKNKKVILFNSGSDTLIEWVWHNRKECDFFSKIKRMGFWAVSGFNFSVIGGECAFAHALNQKRSLYSAFLAERNGLISIPHVYALTKYHVDRWSKWFALNQNINLFVINCQLQKSNFDINQVAAVTNHFLIKFPHLNVILQGYPLNKIDKFKYSLDRIHFADKGVIKYAQLHTQLTHDLQKNKIIAAYSKESIQKLVYDNLTAKQYFLEYNKQMYRKEIAA